MSRYDLSEFEWRVIQPLLPNKPRGVPRVDDRRVLNGIFWVLRSGSPWRDLPERYGPYTTWNYGASLLNTLISPCRLSLGCPKKRRPRARDN